MSIYVDYNATTPLDGRVHEAMAPYLHEEYGNPSSIHRYGRRARAAVDRARAQIASLVNVSPSQVIFTSGGTEANNLALKGAAALAAEPGTIAVSAIEHASVLAPARALCRQGWRMDTLAVDGQGVVSPMALRETLDEDARLVSVMWANNETGVIQDIEAISEAVRGANCLMHTDAVQAAGKLACDFTASGVHMMSLSGHKIHGPKGVGALILDSGLELEPLLHGGAHERGLRAGTENVPAIVGFGMAAQLLQSELTSRRAHLLELRDHLESGLQALDGEIIIFSEQAERLPNTVFFAVPRVDGETLLMNLDERGFAVASGSACSSGSADPSHVLMAMGVERDLARGAVRLSLGKENTRADIEALVDALGTQIDSLRKMGEGAWA